MKKTRISGATPRMRVCVECKELLVTLLSGCVRYHTVSTVFVRAGGSAGPTVRSGLEA